MVDIATPFKAYPAASGARLSRSLFSLDETPLSALRNFPATSPRSGLARVIESEIIPRLMLAHRATEVTTTAPVPGAAAVEGLVRLTLANGASEVAEHVQALVEAGLPLDQAYAELLAPAARRLGDLWNDDRISFTDVTVGLSRLQQAVRGLAVRFPPRAAAPAAPAACFVTAPGEQHSFGLLLLEDHFRRAGWRTWLDTAATAEDSVAAVSEQAFDVFGLSATSDASLTEVAEVIAEVRRRSLNPDIHVMVGGRLFIEQPELAGAVGADLAAASAEDALSAADKAVKRPALA